VIKDGFVGHSLPPFERSVSVSRCWLTATFYVACQALPSIFSVFSSFFGRRL